MSKYGVEIRENALRDLELLRKNEPQFYKKVLALLKELQDHPRIGTGKPEQLKGCNGLLWSRRISKKHRLVYKIVDTVFHVDVLGAGGHYDDK